MGVSSRFVEWLAQHCAAGGTAQKLWAVSKTLPAIP